LEKKKRKAFIEAQLRGPSTIGDNIKKWANLFLNIYGGERCG
jgi:hypothetical protein